MKKWFFLSLVLLLSLPGQASARHGQPGRWHTSFEIGPDGDTISVVPIKPVFVFSKKADLRRYRKLVEAVKKVYPVAQAAKAQMVQMEAELLRLETKKEQKQYIKGIAAAIKKEYTPVLKHMTRTQGRVLLKLIDRVLMLVTGADKAEILRKAFFGPVTPWVPASILQFHPDVTLICDRAAWDGAGMGKEN